MEDLKSLLSADTQAGLCHVGIQWDLSDSQWAVWLTTDGQWVEFYVNKVNSRSEARQLFDEAVEFYRPL